MSFPVNKVARGLTKRDVGKIIEYNGVKGLLRSVEYFPGEFVTHVDLVVGFDLGDMDEGIVWE